MARQKSLQVPLCRYADPLVGDLRRLLPAALKRWDDEAIHESRVATRRLRAAMDLVEPLLPDKCVAPLRRTLRRLRRRLGMLRDLDVMVDHLQPLIGHRRHSQAANWLAEQLQQARNAARRKAHKKNPPDKWITRLDVWETLREQVIALGDDVQARMQTSLHAHWNSFAEQADRLSAHMLDEQRQTLQDPHELRIAGKLLRYTFEMLARTKNRPPAALERTFKRMQKELGLWHDHVVLTEWTMRLSLDRALASHNPDLQAQVLAISTAMLRTAERHLRRFARLWDQQGPTLSQLVEPLSQPDRISAPQTDPDLFDSISSPVQESPPKDEPSAA